MLPYDCLLLRLQQGHTKRNESMHIQAYVRTLHTVELCALMYCSYKLRTSDATLNSTTSEYNATRQCVQYATIAQSTCTSNTQQMSESNTDDGCMICLLLL